MSKVTTKSSAIVALAAEIAANANKPMSPDQIKGKFQLEFPFTVKRVVVGPTDRSCRFEHSPIGEILTFTSIVDDGSYVYAGPCETHTAHSVDGDSERFVLVGDAT